jgi:small-conductance mechanosensitive channel
MTVRAPSLGHALASLRRAPRATRAVARWLCLWLLVAAGALAPAARVQADPVSRTLATVASGLAADASLDRTTPRRALQSFLSASREGDFVAASHCLDLRSLPDPSVGPELAEELSYVLYRRVPIDLTQVPDEPGAREGQVTVDSFTVGEQDVPLALARVKFDDGISRWVVARSTVRRIPDVVATLRTSAWEQRFPRALRSPVIFGNAPWQWLGILVSVLIAYAVGRVAAAICVRIGASFARRTTTLVDDVLVQAARRPLRTMFASTLFGGLVYALQTSLAVTKVLGHVAYTGFVLGFAWLVLAAFASLARLVSPAGDEAGASGHDSAGERTRRALLQRIASAAVVGVTLALLLLQFDVVRHVGLSLLASAGIAGVVLGLAAQKSLAGLIAGIQLSITQPIRLGDTIFIEGEIGVVQDIFLTYAVVRFWDDRCVVVPLSRFLDQPFQNWTLLSHELTGVVLLHVKFTAPVAALRAKVRELCEAHPRWDGRRSDLQVGDSDMYGMVLRIMVSARSPAESWDLKCHVREGIIEYLKGVDGGVHLG